MAIAEAADVDRKADVATATIKRTFIFGINENSRVGVSDSAIPRFARQRRTLRVSNFTGLSTINDFCLVKNLLSSYSFENLLFSLSAMASMWPLMRSRRNSRSRMASIAMQHKKMVAVDAASSGRNSHES